MDLKSRFVNSYSVQTSPLSAERFYYASGCCCCCCSSGSVVDAPVVGNDWEDSMADLVHIRNLSVGYGGRTVLGIDDLRVDEGQVVGIIGGNGAGKSTFVKCLLGDAPYKGTVDRSFSMRDVGVLMQDNKYSGLMRVGELASIVARRPVKDVRLASWLSEFELEGLLNRKDIGFVRRRTSEDDSGNGSVVESQRRFPGRDDHGSRLREPAETSADGSTTDCGQNGVRCDSLLRGTGGLGRQNSCFSRWHPVVLGQCCGT